MYKIIGADKKEYGPISVDQVRVWVQQGRANKDTLATAEGTTDWKPLSSFAEFTAFFASPPPPPPAVPPSISEAEAQALTQEILTRDYDLNIGHCIDRAWQLVKSDFWPTIAVSALIFIIIMVASGAYVGLVVNGPLLGGLFFYYFKKMRGERAELSDAFSAFSTAFVQTMLAYLVTVALEGVGFALCILPGIYLLVAWQFTLPLVVDRKIDFWPAMEVSRKVITKHWWKFFGFLIVMLLLNLVGLLACIVGVFISFPVTSIALLYAYEDIFRATPASPQPV